MAAASSGPGQIVGILLAAGFSTRFGANKLLARLADGTLVAEQAARHLIEVLPRSVAVVRPGVPDLEKRLRERGLVVSVCDRAEEGMGTTLAHAVAQAGAAAGYVVALADMPFVRARTIAQVAERLGAGAPLVAPSYGGVRGHPVGFGAGYRDELCALRGEHAAREILRRDRPLLVEVDDPGVLKDIDVPADIPSGA
jgi:molybdenum cofactor cytidylyltransferase